MGDPTDWERETRLRAMEIKAVPGSIMVATRLWSVSSGGREISRGTATGCELSKEKRRMVGFYVMLMYVGGGRGLRGAVHGLIRSEI